MKATFDMWSIFHYFMMVFPFVLTVLLYYLYKNKDEKKQKNVALILSILMVLILIARSIFMIDRKGGLNPEAIPFQVCHFANFMMLLASFKKWKTVGAIAWCLNFPAALVSLIFANSLTHYDNILNIQGLAYISGHMLIVAGGLYMLLIGIIQIDKHAFKNMYKTIGIMYLISIVINNWFNHIFAKTDTDANYFYSFKPEEGTPLQTFFDLGKTYHVIGMSVNPIYLLSVALLGSVIVFIFYLIYRFKSSYTKFELSDKMDI